METLTPEEARVLGCLIEKERATPEYYPLSLNALVNACNQKTSREPVVEYDEATVETALEMLQARGLANWVHQAGSRVRKFRHAVGERLGINQPSGQAILCVLLLRGPQTMGEIRQRTERLHFFATLEDVGDTLRELGDREDPMVCEWPRLPGRKERRYGHTLCGPAPEGVDLESPEKGVPTQGGLPKTWTAELDARESAVRAVLEELRGEIASLKAEFETFKRQFE